MSIVPPPESTPASGRDALIQTKPISQELADILAPRIMRTTHRDRGCWLRDEGYRRKTGYSYISRMVRGEVSSYLAHRVVYVHYFGPIPTGLTIDHLCERPACVNPKHLRAVTLRENVLRSTKNPMAINARKVTCPAGHVLQEIEPGHRRCRECARQRTADRRLKLKAQGVPANESHGTRRAYHYWSCRCDECRAWQRSDYKAKKAA